jgi:signal peptidase I
MSDTSDDNGQELATAVAGAPDDPAGMPGAFGGLPPAAPPPLTGQPDPVPAGRREPAPMGGGMRSLVEWVVIIVVALVGALVIRTVLIQAFFIPSASMEPTLEVHDRILVNKLSYHLHPVHRGDIVVFKRSKDMVGDGDIKDLVKRVIGLPGETISTSPDGDHLEINGKILNEPYLPAGINMGPIIGDAPGCAPSSHNDCVIPQGDYFVMGDNRDDSSDSRVFGPIEKSQIVGRAFILIWPIPDIRLF